MRTRDREELFILGAAVVVLLLTWAFVALAGEVREGDTRHFDEQILLALRDGTRPGSVAGPWWLARGAQDITALGSVTVLTLTVAAVTGYLLLHGLRRYAVFVLVASIGGWFLQWSLKLVFVRDRPDVVPHLTEVMTSSFPSGHALTSAAVYLTLGALLMRIAEGRAARYYCIGFAMLLTFLVGSSRVVLGVHYPTDVIGGWLVGLTWAVLCWALERVLERRAGLRRVET